MGNGILSPKEREIIQCAIDTGVGQDGNRYNYQRRIFDKIRPGIIDLGLIIKHRNDSIFPIDQHLKDFCIDELADLKAVLDKFLADL